MSTGGKRKHADDGQRKAKRKKNIQYNTAWESMPELKDWLCKSRRDPRKAYCKICHKDLEYKTRGAYDLKRHAAAHKSLEAIEATQPRLQFQPSQASAMSVTVQDSELRIGFFLAEHHLCVHCCRSSDSTRTTAVPRLSCRS